MAERKHLEILDDDESDDPILSVVNIVDVFLVIIAVLLIVIAVNPLNPLAEEDVVVIRNPGEMNMQMIVKRGKELTNYQSSGEIGEGKGRRAGVAYRMEDGSIVYVPEDASNPD